MVCIQPLKLNFLPKINTFLTFLALFSALFLLFPIQTPATQIQSISKPNPPVNFLQTQPEPTYVNDLAKNVIFLNSEHKNDAENSLAKILLPKNQFFLSFDLNLSYLSRGYDLITIFLTDPTHSTLQINLPPPNTVDNTPLDYLTISYESDSIENVFTNEDIIPRSIENWELSISLSSQHNPNPFPVLIQKTTNSVQILFLLQIVREICQEKSTNSICIANSDDQVANHTPDLMLDGISVRFDNRCRYYPPTGSFEDSTGPDTPCSQYYPPVPLSTPCKYSPFCNANITGCVDGRCVCKYPGLYGSKCTKTYRIETLGITNSYLTETMSVLDAGFRYHLHWVSYDQPPSDLLITQFFVKFDGSLVSQILPLTGVKIDGNVSYLPLSSVLTPSTDYVSMFWVLSYNNLPVSDPDYNWGLKSPIYPLYFHEWAPDDWGTCNGPCLIGKQIRKLACVRLNKNVRLSALFHENLCRGDDMDANEAPNSSQDCTLPVSVADCNGNGTCDPQGRYCTCFPGYFGLSCEQNTCQNCFLDGTASCQGGCVCKPGFTGEWCQINKVCNHQKCHNGGFVALKKAGAQSSLNGDESFSGQIETQGQIVTKSVEKCPKNSNTQKLPTSNSLDCNSNQFDVTNSSDQCESQCTCVGFWTSQSQDRERCLTCSLRDQCSSRGSNPKTPVNDDCSSCICQRGYGSTTCSCQLVYLNLHFWNPPAFFKPGDNFDNTSTRGDSTQRSSHLALILSHLKDIWGKSSPYPGDISVTNWRADLSDPDDESSYTVLNILFSYALGCFRPGKAVGLAAAGAIAKEKAILREQEVKKVFEALAKDNNSVHARRYNLKNGRPLQTAYDSYIYDKIEKALSDFSRQSPSPLYASPFATLQTTIPTIPSNNFNPGYGTNLITDIDPEDLFHVDITQELPYDLRLTLYAALRLTISMYLNPLNPYAALTPQDPSHEPIRVLIPQFTQFDTSVYDPSCKNSYTLQCAPNLTDPFAVYAPLHAPLRLAPKVSRNPLNLILIITTLLLAALVVLGLICFIHCFSPETEVRVKVPKPVVVEQPEENQSAPLSVHTAPLLRRNEESYHDDGYTHNGDVRNDDGDDEEFYDEEFYDEDYDDDDDDDDGDDEDMYQDEDGDGDDDDIEIIEPPLRYPGSLEKRLRESRSEYLKYHRRRRVERWDSGVDNRRFVNGDLLFEHFLKSRTGGGDDRIKICGRGGDHLGSIAERDDDDRGGGCGGNLDIYELMEFGGVGDMAGIEVNVIDREYFDNNNNKMEINLHLLGNTGNTGNTGNNGRGFSGQSQFSPKNDPQYRRNKNRNFDRVRSSRSQEPIGGGNNLVDQYIVDDSDIYDSE